MLLKHRHCVHFYVQCMHKPKLIINKMYRKICTMFCLNIWSAYLSVWKYKLGIFCQKFTTKDGNFHFRNLWASSLVHLNKLKLLIVTNCRSLAWISFSYLNFVYVYGVSNWLFWSLLFNQTYISIIFVPLARYV